MNTFKHQVRPANKPFASLSREFQREVNRALRARDAAYRGSRGVYPPVNLHESDEGFVLTAELPGVAPDDIDVQIEGATITLSGERKADFTVGAGAARPEENATNNSEKTISVHRRERQIGSFRRAFELPAEVDLDKARATHKSGVLTLDLPKSAATKPRQIRIDTP